ncbi:hypothetical protein DAPPUDRAFT_250590 [Daphnia pulex]|uniref:Uncharacterized protein n=1 Tax=Daphnia pulex TaxID=6669 RepID=E9GYW4_DAPPU|nr:hypothetical protein DAPPUDRAFT_250590 [Daphnia pulex]|eukprot:EFX75337.1 hypothetical protein DAPPUDRAFT_250590 [Daphnia pulex]
MTKSMESDSHLFLKMLADSRLDATKKEILDAEYSQISNEALEEVAKTRTRLLAYTYARDLLVKRVLTLTITT